MPYDHKNTTPHGSPAQRVRLMLENLNRLHCKQRCVVGSGGGSVGLVLLVSCRIVPVVKLLIFLRLE